MINNRGQAFDAFKLLIAAVIAGAILVILLGMLSGFINPSANPLDTMANTLQQVKAGAAKTSPQIVSFEEGDGYIANGVAGKANMGQDTIQFCCTSTTGLEGCSDTYAFDRSDFSDFFTCTDTDLDVIQSVSGKIRAFCPVNPNDVCVVGFVSTARQQ